MDKNDKEDEQPKGASSTPGKGGRVTMHDKVLASLQYGLMSGFFLPGQVLSLRKIAANLDTSLMPVRESVSRLVAAHALEELPNRTVRVPKLSARGLIELFEVRTLIEGMAARVACERVTDELIEELGEINDRLLAAHAQNDMGQVLIANKEFHFAIYRAANSDILMPLIESLWLRCGPTMYFSMNSPRNLWDTSMHLRLLDAFRAKDTGAAETAMVDDIMKTGAYLIAEAQREPETGPFASLSNAFRLDRGL
ncbi:GntR family transcriptional regulator [Acuticoccus mangrovi]|uniref:GntR family transcriptional regulator n=1 Tax=Acuticoccus mangrovi TaxID=2796142 RepID=A0A934IKN4_9HYPH|nr:GntR family transcriptional regulator [Acuticoccus mangrovi]MBJ3776731.1 GntR family transcriptional regulator [Acuticoccus mangrovi]